MLKDDPVLSINSLGVLNCETLMESFLGVSDSTMDPIPATLDSLISAYETRLRGRRSSSRKRSFPFWDNITNTEPPQQNLEHNINAGEANESNQYDRSN